MTWKQKVVVGILLLIARWLTEDEWVRAEIKTLATHISVNAPQPEVSE